MRRAGHLLIASCAACHAAAPATPACPTGDVAIRTQRDVDALSGCRAIRGALTIRTAASVELHALASLEQIDGDLAIGPTLALTSIDGFAHLRAIGGALRVHANAEATGAYFPALERVGAIDVGGNPSLAELMAPRLAVAGDVAIEHEAALEVIDLGQIHPPDARPK